MRHQRSTGRFLRLNRPTSIAEDLEVCAVVSLDFCSWFRRRFFVPSIPVRGIFGASDMSESLWPFVEPDDGRVEGDDCEFEEVEVDEGDVRPVVSAFEAEVLAS